MNKKFCVVFALIASTIFTSAATASIEHDPIWPSGTNPATGDPVNGFCDCQQAILDNELLDILPPEFLGLLSYLAPGTGDINGTSFVVTKPDIQLGLGGNGMLDCSTELKLVEEVLRDTNFNVNGLTHDDVLTAWNDNDYQFNSDVGSYWGLLGTMANGLGQTLKGHMLIGDGSASFSLPVGNPPEFTRVDCTGSAGFIQAVMFLLGDNVTHSAISFDSQQTTLAAPLTADSASVTSTVTLAAPLNLRVGDYIRVGHEYMTVHTAGDTSTVIVKKRGLATSKNPAVAHEVGEQVYTGYRRMPEKFSRLGDADGDGASNDCEYSIYGATDYVANALDPTKTPTWFECNCHCGPQFRRVFGAGWFEMGSPHSLSVDIYGEMAILEYQWYKDGVEIEDATDVTYTMAAPTESDSGVYICEVNYYYGKWRITSPTIYLKIVPEGALPVANLAALAATLSIVALTGIALLQRTRAARCD